MAEIILKNEQLEIEVKLHGAELCSLKDVESGCLLYTSDAADD